MMLDVVKTVSQLVAIPSVNPMGSQDQSPHFGESRLTEFLESCFRQLRIPTWRQSVGPGQDNLLARLEGYPPPEGGGKLVLLDAHQDTVPVEGMKIDPWKPEIRQGRLFGRGACDTKGGMAAMLTAISRLAEEQAAGRPTVVMACTINEEYGFSGVSKLVGSWPEPMSIFGRKPDAAIVAEPTGLNVVVAHKGVVRWRCHARGRAAHSSRPDLGENAIYKMARALAAIERYQQEVVGRLPGDPLCGPATISVGTIRGGASVNTVPDLCTIEIDRRVPPGEHEADVQRHLIEYLGAAGLGSTLQNDPPYLQAPPLSDAANGPLADRLAAVAAAVTGACEKVRVPYATEAAFYAAAGVPSVVFGPGFLEQAHTDSEWVAVEQLHQAAEIYYRWIRSAA